MIELLQTHTPEQVNTLVDFFNDFKQIQESHMATQQLIAETQAELKQVETRLAQIEAMLTQAAGVLT